MTQQRGGMAHIRDYYGVPARRGARIRFDYRGSNEGTIVSAVGARLRVRFDNGQACILHPWWNLTYLEGGGEG